MVDPPIPAYGNVRKLLTGAALLHPVDGFQVSPENDKFAQAWNSVDESFVERLSSQATVVTPTGTFKSGDFESASIDYFHSNAPEPGSSFVFDATMAVGIGACIAERQTHLNGLETEFISGKEQVEGIRATNFSGASGHVGFGVSSSLLGNVTGSRLPAYMTIGVFNLFPPTTGNEGYVRPDAVF